MAVKFYHVFTVLAVFSTLYVCVNTFSIIQDKKLTNGENLRIFTRHKRSVVTSNFCLDKNEIWYLNKCRSPEEYLRLKDGDDILNITDTGDMIEETEIYIETSAVTEPTKFETTHQEPTEVHSSTVLTSVQTVRQSDTTVLSTSTARISDEVHRDRKSNDRTRDYGYVLTTKIEFVTDTVRVVEDKVTNIKTSTVSEPTKLETTHQEATKVHSSTVVKEFPTVSQLDKTNSTSRSTARILDEFYNYLWIPIGVVVELCFIFLLYWYCCLRRNKNPKKLENENNDTEAAVMSEMIEC